MAVGVKKSGSQSMSPDADVANRSGGFLSVLQQLGLGMSSDKAENAAAVTHYAFQSALHVNQK